MIQGFSISQIFVGQKNDFFSFALPFQMDKETVWSASGDDLAGVEITENGDVLALKSFCIPRNNGESGELTNFIKSTGLSKFPGKSKSYVG